MSSNTTKTPTKITAIFKTKMKNFTTFSEKKSTSKIFFLKMELKIKQTQPIYFLSTKPD